MYVCTYDGVVYKLIMPLEHVASELSHSWSFPFVFAQDMMRNPLSVFDNMMVNMKNRMGEMHRNFVSLLV